MMNATTEVSVLTAQTVFPSGYSDALRDAMSWPTPYLRIDALTDEMAAHGIVRKREDCSRLGDWTRMRMAGAAFKRGDVA